MGLFSGLKKAVKGIFKGIGKVFKKVGKAFKKVLSNKYVGYAMTAVAVVSGGIALANGVTSGVSAFQKSAADTFLGKVGEASTAFMEGAAAGFSNPMETGKDLLGMGDGLKNVAAQTGATINPATGDAVAPELAEAASENIAGSTAKATAQAGVEGGESVAGTPAEQAQKQVMSNDGLNYANPQDGNTVSQATGKAAAPGLASAPGGAGAGGSAVSNFAKSAVNGLTNFAKTPGGGQIIAGFGTNYFGAKAQLEAEEEERKRNDKRWNDFIDDRNRNYRPSRPPQGLMQANSRLRDRAAAARQRQGVN